MTTSDGATADPNAPADSSGNSPSDQPATAADTTADQTATTSDNTATDPSASTDTSSGNSSDQSASTADQNSTAAAPAADASTDSSSAQSGEQASAKDGADQSAAAGASERIPAAAIPSAKSANRGGTNAADASEAKDSAADSFADRMDPGELLSDAPPIEVSRDQDGTERRSNEVVALVDSTSVDTVRKLGFAIVAQRPLNVLGGDLLRISLPAKTDAAQALGLIRAVAPSAIAEENHIYRTAGIAASSDKAPSTAGTEHSAVSPQAGLVGIVDTSVAPTYPGLGPELAEARSFAVGPAPDPTHGTAVAEIVAGKGIPVVSANAFAKDSNGADAASTDAIIRSINWLIARGAVVINLSLEGPPDAAIGAAIKRAQDRGCVVVAAAGNMGPNASPSYPAAFPSVVAVTAIDKSNRVYRYANQGSYITFAALGVDVETAHLPSGKQMASGTSYAAPVVAGLIARMDRRRTRENADLVVSLLEKRARHLGEPGRNSVFGYGALDSDGRAVLASGLKPRPLSASATQ